MQKTMTRHRRRHGAKGRRCHHGGGMPLSLARCRVPLTVQDCTGRDDVQQHLARLGFVPGAEVQTVSESGSNMIVDVKGSRLALDRKLAHRIVVND